RPWTGENAIHKAAAALAPLAALEPLDVEVDGLVFREVVSAVAIEGGTADNVVPDRCVARLNYRYAPGRSREQAEARVRELAGDAEVEILGNSPPAHVVLDRPLVTRLREAGGLAVRPKQAWTPVAQFAEAGLDAVNLGPGATRYAHPADEPVEPGGLVQAPLRRRGRSGDGGDPDLRQQGGDLPPCPGPARPGQRQGARALDGAGLPGLRPRRPLCRRGCRAAAPARGERVSPGSRP